MFRHVCSLQTQQLGAPRKYPRPETAGCIQQEVSVYVKMYHTLKFAVLRDAVVVAVVTLLAFKTHNINMKYV